MAEEKGSFDLAVVMVFEDWPATAEFAGAAVAEGISLGRAIGHRWPSG